MEPACPSPEEPPTAELPEWDEETRCILLETFSAEAADLLDQMDQELEGLILGRFGEE